MNSQRLHIVKEEVSEHLKFTVISVLLCLSLILVINKFAQGYMNETTFSSIHYIHLFLATITPVAIYYAFNPDVVRAIGVGILSSSIGCTVSDSVFPYIGGHLFGYDMKLHICILEEPQYAWAAIFIGAFAGIFLPRLFKKITHVTHFVHTFAATTAAIVYLLTFGFTGSDTIQIIYLIIILFISVLVPCLLSDIVIPSLVFSESSFNEIMEHHHSHSHSHNHD
ncbi:MAG: hypothetical protein JSS63_13640 [Bacteroidetes bacterium]|nr:hypothetical protein [Bacteroidota bacterium]MBX7046080.1 hypothetical protein [Ignavibacteria bacterium]